MISDPMYQKMLFFVNHFRDMSSAYDQMAYSIMEAAKDKPLNGFYACLCHEGGERWKTSKWIAEEIKKDGKKVVLAELPKPKDAFENPKALFDHAMLLEKGTLDAIKTAIDEAVATKDYTSEEILKSLFESCTDEYREIEHITNQITVYGENLDALYLLNEYLYKKYGEDKNPKSKYRK